MRVARFQALTLALFCAATCATPPTLYQQPALQSPVRADPDDLLYLPGIGFSAGDTVVYRATYNTRAALSAPTEVPQVSNPEVGVAPIVSSADLPYSLTIVLPAVMRPGQSYAIWVRNAEGEWSRPIRINDARPLWISPARVNATGAEFGLPRYLKVIGRNLEPAAGARTRVRLKGPQTTVLVADRHPQVSALDSYVALVRLPGILAPGKYHIELSRDGQSWIPLAGQSLQVRADPAPQPEFPVDREDFGGCRPDDSRDDTGCVIRALQAARTAGGGTVVFGKGTWDLFFNPADGLSADNGLLVPVGVNLAGRGPGVTQLIRHRSATGVGSHSAFTLMGNNVVRGLTLRDAATRTREDHEGSLLQLGKHSESPGPADPGADREIDEITITGNVFQGSQIAISDGGLPISRLFITHNVFGAYESSLELAGNRFNVEHGFRLDDSVIAYNVFKPSSFLSIPDKRGVVATEIGAGHRVDFSDNLADGAATDFLDSPNDARGWRAAFFWHMNNNQELLLVSGNRATCTGDKIGDGEAIAYDNNGNTFAFERAQMTVAASSDTIVVPGPLRLRQNDREIPINTYYIGHWIQVGEGPGRGQVRKIDSYRVDAGSGKVTFKISPAWDVIPVTGQTRISVGREFWQAYAVANSIDHRRPLCQKSNRSAKKGGVISLWAQIADSAVEGNQQFDSDGIVIQQLYSAHNAACGADCESRTHYVSSMEIRGNTIDGEYDWTDDCSSSGILGSVGASPTPESAPPTVSTGLSISHNIISHADAWRGGAISLRSTWFDGPPPHRWPVVNNALIFKNSITALEGAPASGCRGDLERPRTAISLSGAPLAQHTVLYANRCATAPIHVDSSPLQAVTVCRIGTGETCECPK
jgi:hypothetical protein